MKTLYLLRHAKSSWNDADQEDVKRPLNERGHEEADRLSDHLASLLPPPEGIGCSPSLRTRQTLAYFLEVWPLEPFRVQITPKLYLADDQRLLKTIQRFPDDMNIVMMLGHNPGLTDLLHALDKTASEAVPELGTCEFVQIDFDVDHWEDVRKDLGTMKFCIRAKDLPS